MKPKNQTSFKQPIRSEHTEQVYLVNWLRSKGILFTSSQNGAWTKNFVMARKLKQEGLQKGFPDLMIFTLTSKTLVYDNDGGYMTAHGVAVEMKREKGGVQSAEQKQWQKDLEDCGWVYLLCKGYDDAVKKLSELGY